MWGWMQNWSAATRAEQASVANARCEKNRIPSYLNIRAERSDARGTCPPMTSATAGPNFFSIHLEAVVEKITEPFVNE